MTPSDGTGLNDALSLVFLAVFFVCLVSLVVSLRARKRARRSGWRERRNVDPRDEAGLN